SPLHGYRPQSLPMPRCSWGEFQRPVNDAYNPPVPSSKWVTVPTSSTTSEIYWTKGDQKLAVGDGDGVDPLSNWRAQGISYLGEEFRIKSSCLIGRDFICQDAFTQYNVNTTTLLVTKYRYPFHLTRAIIEYNGLSIDITNEIACDGNNGIPYALQQIPTMPYILKVWAQYDFGQHRPFYWQVRYQPPAQRMNTCWRGAGASTRSAIANSEAWWDRTWTSGSGALGADGKPNGEGVTYDPTSYRGKSAGWVWSNEGSPGWDPCLESTWTW
ncbi:MAG TPA: hypothetical protein VFN09_07750, partial [Rhodanobacteraceae bacterium]|nr:hypothetical protein [Rhodanobacteraceae bacterium]